MTLADFKRRASEERSGLRRIFEQAREHLRPIELVRLIAHLEEVKPVTIIDQRGHRRRVEEPFKLRPKDRRMLALALLDSGVGESRIPPLAGVSERTWRRIRADRGRQTPETGGHGGLNKPRNRPFSTPQVSSPILSFDASSGALLTLARHRQLLHALGAI
jgi:hypothetical protein